MSLARILGFSASIACGSIKGFSDGAGIDLDIPGFVMPALGIFTPPAVSFVYDDFNGLIGETLLAGIATGVSYAIGRTAGHIVKHYA